MKVVLFCGGLGTRLREHSETIPKPLVTIGDRPILWNVMKYYAHFGHKDFILCLGFRGDLIREFFLNYDAHLYEDFCIEPGGMRIPEKSDIDDWRITFVDTGLHSNIGQRLVKVRDYLEGEEVFLANYSDQLTDLSLPRYLEEFEGSGAVAGFVTVRPSQSFHCVALNNDGFVSGVHRVQDCDVWINGGYMALRSDIFDFIRDGEELVEEPFRRLIGLKKLYGYRFEGFWAAMDTFKDKMMLDRMDGQGDRPWQVWRPAANGAARSMSEREDIEYQAQRRTMPAAR